MTSWLCCRRRDMGQALHHPSRQDSDARDGSGSAPLTMAEVIRERKKKAGMAGLSTLRRRLAQVTRRNNSGDDWSHARYIRSVVHSWKTAEVCALHQELEAGAVLRDLSIQADLARAPAPTLRAALRNALTHRWCTDVELECDGVVVPAHRALLCARSHYFRALLHDHWSENRVKLEGLPTPITLPQLNAVLLAIYRGAPDSNECICERRDSDLDIISTDRPTGCGGLTCSSGAAPLSALGVSTADPQHDCRYLLDSGEYADCRLVFWADTGGDPSLSGEYSPSLYLRAHKLMLAARSRMFRSVLTRGGSDICVDEGVLPQRFAAALLHATYTDQVDLNLIGRNTSSPNNTGNKNSTSRSQSQLEDAFQLYEIARFLEMSIVSQGCEDVIVSRLDPETLPAVLRWVTHPSSSPYVRRQAYRYLLDEFPRIMQSPASSQLTSTSIASALRSPNLQCSESQALKALLKWGETQSNSDQLTSLASLIRVEHIHGDNSVLQQAIRRGIVQTPPSQMLEPHCSASAWLGRGPHRPARIFLPYLEEIKTLLESQNIPAAEVARVRRSRYLHKIPDTLYMVNASPAPDSISSTIDASAHAAWSCLTPTEIHQLKTRTRELYSADTHTPELFTQICIRAVRERGLPDTCARVLCREMLHRLEDSWRHLDDADDDCGITDESTRSLSASSLRPPSASDSRGASRRDTPDEQRDRSRANMPRPRLSSAVPDVAMGPNANTHLLTVRDYHHNFGATVLQLDLGDGATHAPPPGSRAQRAARQNRNEMMMRPNSAGNGMELSAFRVYPHSASPRPVPPIPPLPNSPRCSHDNFANLVQDRNLQLFDRSNCFNALNCRPNDEPLGNVRNVDGNCLGDPIHINLRNNDLNPRINDDNRVNDVRHRNNEVILRNNDLIASNNHGNPRNNDGNCRVNDPLHLNERTNEIRHRNNDVNLRNNDLIPRNNDGNCRINDPININERTNEIRHRNNDLIARNNDGNSRNNEGNCRTNDPLHLNDRTNEMRLRNNDLIARNIDGNCLSNDSIHIKERTNELRLRNNDTNPRINDTVLINQMNNELRHRNEQNCLPNELHINIRNNDILCRTIDNTCHTLDRRHRNDTISNIHMRCPDERHFSILPERRSHRNQTPELSETNYIQLSQRNTPINEKSNFLSERNLHQRTHRNSPDQITIRTPERITPDRTYLSDRNINARTEELQLPRTSFNNRTDFDRKCQTLDRQVLSQRNSDGTRTPDVNTYLTLRNNSCERRVCDRKMAGVHVRYAGGHASRESLRRTPSPRHLKRHEYFRPPPDFRHDPSYGNSSRGHSPSNYA